MYHKKNTKKVIRNLQHTKIFILVYNNIDDLEIFGYIDLDLDSPDDYIDSDVDSPDDRKYRSLCIKMAGGKIFWKSIKQTVTASSNIQAEFVASHGATI